jgi:hypothetical protein
MVAYNVGNRVRIPTTVVEANDIDLAVYAGDIEDSTIVVEIVRLVKGRTWEVQLPDGSCIEVASRLFQGVVGSAAGGAAGGARGEADGGGRGRGRARGRGRGRGAGAGQGGQAPSTPADEDVDEEDCEESSGDEDGRERFFDSAPTKRPVEEEWEECTIPVDARDAAGIQSRKAGLRGSLESAEPVLTLFTWFFPLQVYMGHLHELKARKPGPPGSRHSVPWDQGVFLRFLGLLIRAATHPLPNLSWHWRWPAHLPDHRGF